MDFFDNPRKLTNNDVKRMSIPDEFHRTELSDIRDDGFRSILQNYITNMRSMYDQRLGLFVHGPPASGKGAAAAVILKEARRRYKPGLFIAIWQLRDSLVNRMLYPIGKTPMDRAREVDFLVLDGLDKEDRTEKLFTLTDMSRLVVARAQQRKLTIITSLLSPRDMAQDSVFQKFWSDVENYLHPLKTPDPTDAKLARKEQMKKLLMGDDS